MLVKYLQSRVPWLLKATLNHKVGLPALCRETAELNKGFSCAFIRGQKFCISGKPSVCIYQRTEILPIWETQCVLLKVLCSVKLAKMLK